MSNADKFNDFLVTADAVARNFGWRRGQAAFNALAELRPDLAEQVRGTLRDPFNDDSRLGEFYAFVRQGW